MKSYQKLLYLKMKRLKLNLKPLVKKFEIYSKMNTLSELTGNYLSVFRGRGYDFDTFRDYNETDDSSRIDWKASLRANKLLVKELIEERNMNVFFLFDVSDSMLFASTSKLKCEYGAELVAALAFMVLGANDSVGMAMFSDKINHLIPLNMGNHHYYRIIKELSNPANYGGKFNFAKALKSIENYLPRSCTIIVVSDCIGMGESWKRRLKIASKKFYFSLLIMVRDPVDNFLPTNVNQVSIKDPFSKDKLIVDPNILSYEYGLKSKYIKKKVKKYFLKRGCDTIELLTNQHYEKKIIKYFVEKRQKWK